MFNENVICAYTYISMAVSVPMPSPSACLQVHSLVEWASSWHTALRMEPSTGLLFLSGCFRQASCLLANSPWKSWERQREGGKKREAPIGRPLCGDCPENRKWQDESVQYAENRSFPLHLPAPPSLVNVIITSQTRRATKHTARLEEKCQRIFHGSSHGWSSREGLWQAHQSAQHFADSWSTRRDFWGFFSLLFVWGSPSFQERDRTITSSPVHQTPMPSMLNKTWTKLGGLGCRKCEGRRINKKQPWTTYSQSLCPRKSSRFEPGLTDVWQSRNC